MTAVKITAPNHEYTGLSAGVMFTNGVAYVDDENPQIHWFANNGYGLNASEDPVTGDDLSNADAPTPPPLTSLKKPELQALCRDRSIPFEDSWTKEVLIGLLRGRDGADGNEPGDQRSGNPGEELTGVATSAPAGAQTVAPGAEVRPDTDGSDEATEAAKTDDSAAAPAAKGAGE